MLSTFQNKAFSSLLPAWICDALVAAIIQALITFFVRYIVEPEFSDQCNIKKHPDLAGFDALLCKSEMVLGMSVLAVLFAAFLGTPIWFLLVKFIGKRKTWLLWSLVMAITNALYFAVQKGDAKLCIAISFINGLPFGAKFLADSILADVIDYDEFLTGSRSEATYTMFKSFLPKIAAVAASAIPIALLGLFGHVPPVDGVIQYQHSTCLRNYIRVAIIGVPTVLSLVAFFLKLRYPIKDESQCLQINDGIEKHVKGLPAKCPITGTMYEIVKMTTEQAKEAEFLEYFPGLKDAELAAEDPNEAGQTIKKRAICQFVCAWLFFIGSIVFTQQTFHLLTSAEGDAEFSCLTYPGRATNTNGTAGADKDAFCGIAGGETDLSILPVLAVVCFGISITSLVFTGMRMKAAIKLAQNPPSKEVSELVYEQRLMKAKCRGHVDARVSSVLSLSPSSAVSENPNIAEVELAEQKREHRDSISYSGTKAL